MVSWILSTDGSETNADNLCVGDIVNDGAITVADIIAVDGNPDENIKAFRSIDFVMVNGNIAKNNQNKKALDF